MIGALVDLNNIQVNHAAVGPENFLIKQTDGELALILGDILNSEHFLAGDSPVDLKRLYGGREQIGYAAPECFGR